MYHKWGKIKRNGDYSIQTFYRPWEKNMFFINEYLGNGVLAWSIGNMKSQGMPIVGPISDTYVSQYWELLSIAGSCGWIKLLTDWRI